MSRSGGTPPIGGSGVPKEESTTPFEKEGNIQGIKVIDDTLNAEKQHQHVPQYNYRDPGGEMPNASLSWSDSLDIVIMLIMSIVAYLFPPKTPTKMSDQTTEERQEISTSLPEMPSHPLPLQVSTQEAPVIQEKSTVQLSKEKERYKAYKKEWASIQKADLEIRPTKMMDLLQRLERESISNKELEGLKETVVNAMVQDIINNQGPQFFRESMAAKQFQEDPVQLLKYYAQLENKIKELKDILKGIHGDSSLWKPVNSTIKELEKIQKETSVHDQLLFAEQEKVLKGTIIQTLTNTYQGQLNRLAEEAGLARLNQSEHFGAAIVRMRKELEHSLEEANSRLASLQLKSSSILADIEKIKKTDITEFEESNLETIEDRAPELKKEIEGIKIGLAKQKEKIVKDIEERKQKELEQFELEFPEAEGDFYKKTIEELEQKTKLTKEEKEILTKTQQMLNDFAKDRTEKKIAIEKKYEEEMLTRLKAIDKEFPQKLKELRMQAKQEELRKLSEGIEVLKSKKNELESKIKKLLDLAASAADDGLNTKEFTSLIRLLVYQKALAAYKAHQPKGEEKTFISNYILEHTEELKKSMNEITKEFFGVELETDNLSKIILNAATQVISPSKT